MKFDKKFIIIKSSGHIHALGGIVGPIKTPFLCETNLIFDMINTGIEVCEVLEDKSELVLTKSNYNKDNSLSSKINTKSQKTVTNSIGKIVDQKEESEPKEESKKDEVEEKPAVVEETTKDEAEVSNNGSKTYNFNQNKKNNKKNK